MIFQGQQRRCPRGNLGALVVAMRRVKSQFCGRFQFGKFGVRDLYIWQYRSAERCARGTRGGCQSACTELQVLRGSRYQRRQFGAEMRYFDELRI